MSRITFLTKGCGQALGRAYYTESHALSAFLDSCLSGVLIFPHVLTLRDSPPHAGPENGKRPRCSSCVDLFFCLTDRSLSAPHRQAQVHVVGSRQCRGSWLPVLLELLQVEEVHPGTCHNRALQTPSLICFPLNKLVRVPLLDLN